VRGNSPLAQKKLRCGFSFYFSPGTPIKEGIYDNYFLTSNKTYFSYEAKFYASSYNLVSLFYKNYFFNKKLFFLGNLINGDFFAFTRIFSSKKVLRVRLVKPRLLRFQNQDIYNLFLLTRGNYGKRVRNYYRTKLSKSRNLSKVVKTKSFRQVPTALTPARQVEVMIRTTVSSSSLVYAPQKLVSRTARKQLRALTYSKRVYRFRHFNVLRFMSQRVFTAASMLRSPARVSQSTPTISPLPRDLSLLTPNRLLASSHSFKGNTRELFSSLSCVNRPKHPSTSIVPSNSKSFILHYVGLLLLSKLNFRMRLGSRILSTIRKKLYSFMKPNELRFRAFSARRRLTTIRLIRGLGKSTLVGRKWLSKSYLYSFFKDGYKRFSADASKYAPNSPIFRLNPQTSTNMYHRENLFSFFSSAEGRVKTIKRDVSIERIRFKPGYQRLWRKFRLALAESLNYKYVYQQQLTKYLIKFSRKIPQRSYYTHESVLKNVILYSRLIPDLSMLKMLLSNKIIFLNHRLVSSYLIYVYKNDFIQLEITIWFYIFSKWMLLWTRARNMKFKRLVYRKSLAGKYKVMKQRKQKSYYTPKWIFLVNFDFIDVKPFLEVDYLTLSFFIVYDFRFFYFYKPEAFTENKLNIYRLYNWKYLN